MARSIKEVHTINYYPINEGAARRAKEMNSFSDYKEGSATAEYRAMVDKAAAIAEKQKSRVDPMYHEKIDHLLDTYARKLAENMNQGFAIDARVPSMMIAGPANFPVGKKEKQNRARDSNMEEWRYIQGLLDKIRSTGMGGISADDPAAIEKLQKKLDGLERSQLIMKEVNAYYRKHGKLDGCALLSPDQIEKLKASMASNWRSDPRPFESYQLTNNNAEIRRVKTRIEQLSKQAQREFSGWEFDGGRVEMNQEDNRLQVFFDVSLLSHGCGRMERYWGRHADAWRPLWWWKSRCDFRVSDCPHDDLLRQNRRGTVPGSPYAGIGRPGKTDEYL